MSDIQITGTVDLTDTAARSERDALADRTDVINKVGVLRCLPDDFHATTDMVAEFYQVNIDAIRQTVKRNRDELDEDGYKVVSRGEFESDIASLSNLDPKVRSIGLYSRRAVLRIGMLLRDSTVARRVRDYLLDAEQVSPARELTEDEKLFEAFQILTRRNDNLAIENRTLHAAIERDAPMVAKAEAHTANAKAINRQTFAREVQQWGTKQDINILQEQVYELLRRKGMLIDGHRADRNHATAHAVRSGWAWTQIPTPGWQPPGWRPEGNYTEIMGTAEFVWPVTNKVYGSQSTAKKRADLLESYGATAVVERSSRIIWPEPDEQEAPA